MRPCRFFEFGPLHEGRDGPVPPRKNCGTCLWWDWLREHCKKMKELLREENKK